MPALPARAINLLPYQRRWVEDDSKLKIVVKGRQIGYSFAATLRAVLKCLERKTTWIFLSKGERQSRLLMEKVQDHIRSCGIVARTQESTFFEGASLKQLEVRFRNGSVIYGLPANPDTARGYSGNVTLDEFAFHADAEKIYAALFPTITRGYGLEVISTPNGTQGKFYELAKAAGLTDAGLGARDSGLGISPAALSESPVASREPRAPTWSAHCCDIYDAVRDGLKIDLALLRAGCEDATAWQQEFCCQFVSTAENFFPPELLTPCLSAEATTDFSLGRQTPPLTELGPASAPRSASGFGTGCSGFGEDENPTTAFPPALRGGTLLPDKEGTQSSAKGHGFSRADMPTLMEPCPLPLGEAGPTESGRVRDGAPFSNPESRVASPEFFLGIDIGRRHDRTVFWVDECTPSPPAPLPPGEGGPQGRVRVAVARLVRTLENTPFAEQLDYARELLSLRADVGAIHESTFLIRRACIDATGMGAPLAEALVREFGPRVEPVVFTAAVKEDLAFRTKRRMEARLTLLPDTREIRRAFSAVKKFVTSSGNLRFDAERTEAGHADEFWAKALADLAADPERHRSASAADHGFLADAAPLVSPLAFREVGGNWSEVFV